MHYSLKMSSNFAQSNEIKKKLMKLIIKQVLKVEKGKQRGALQYLQVDKLSKDEVQAGNSDNILKVLKTRASHNLYIFKFIM